MMGSRCASSTPDSRVPVLQKRGDIDGKGPSACVADSARGRLTEENDGALIRLEPVDEVGGASGG